VLWHILFLCPKQKGKSTGNQTNRKKFRENQRAIKKTEKSLKETNG